MMIDVHLVVSCIRFEATWVANRLASSVLLAWKWANVIDK